MTYQEQAREAEPTDPEEAEAPSAPETRHLRLEMNAEGIAWLAFDHADSGANTLSEAVLDELDAHLAALEPAQPAGLVVYSSKPGGFIAGADVNEFTRVADEAEAFRLVRRGQAVMDRLAGLPCPTVALIHGFCLGGGTELALACRHRVAREDPGTRIGLPEVRLGIHPGFGGTWRLPALVGDLAAMDLMLRGSAVSARAAARIGLVDHAVPERQLHKAARTLVRDDPGRHRPGWVRRAPGTWPLRRVVAPYLKSRTEDRAPPEHYPAPYALVDLWSDHARHPDRRQEAEARSVARLLTGSTAQSLARAFLLQERLKGLGRRADFRPERVHVAGAGVMGGDIAAWCAARGLSVSLADTGPERIAPAVKRARRLFQDRLKDRRRVTAAMDRLMPDPKGAGVDKADVVIEAIVEDADAKRALYAELEPRLSPDTLLATNTSSIPLEELAAGLSHPERLVGLHFFNPVAKMQLVEVVTGTATSPETADRACAFARGIDRLPLTVASGPGFLVNRVLMPYLLEAMTLVEEGTAPATVDTAATGFGMPMGPIELADTVGLDVCLSVAENLAGHLGGEVPETLRRRVAGGDLGRKSGRGFYAYHRGRALKGRRAEADGVLADRLLLPLLNEAVRCLREGVVADADLLDAGVIYGTGFAPFRGGPMHHIHRTGPEALRDRLETLAQRHGDRFRPDSGWDAPRL